MKYEYAIEESGVFNAETEAIMLNKWAKEGYRLHTRSQPRPDQSLVRFIFEREKLD